MEKTMRNTTTVHNPEASFEVRELTDAELDQGRRPCTSSIH
jgi:hypothetical protein